MPAPLKKQKPLNTPAPLKTPAALAVLIDAFFLRRASSNFRSCFGNGALLMAMAAMMVGGCLPKPDVAKDPVSVTLPFSDTFDRADLGERYKKTGGTWKITDGRLHSTGEQNIPLWLDVPLGKNVRVEFTTRSASPAVDTKVEIFGDGNRHESGYIVILGGWGNRITTIARLDEHEKSRVEKPTSWKNNQAYRWRVERRDGKKLTLTIDDQLILTYDDAKPLTGKGHDRLAFTNWASDVTYDDLKITALPD